MFYPASIKQSLGVNTSDWCDGSETSGDSRVRGSHICDTVHWRTVADPWCTEAGHMCHMEH